MDWKSKYYLLIKKVQDLGNDMGIYPAALFSFDKEKSYKERDGFKNGWNSAIMEYGIAINSLGFDAEEEMSTDELILLTSDHCYLQGEKLLINLNDTWAWSCGDAEEITKEELPEIARLFRRYGWCGILYWVYKKRGNEKTAFKDNNRFIEFVEKEEQFIKDIPDSTPRACKDYQYTLGGKLSKKSWKFWQ